MSDSDTDSSYPMVAEDITGDGYYNDDSDYNSDYGSDNESDEEQQLMEPLTITHNGQQYNITTDLRQTIPAGTDLSGFDFSTIPIREENSIDGRLNLRGANLERINLSNCNLENVDLSYAVLNNANLSNSRLANAIFFQTLLMGTDLSNLRTISGAYFNYCIINNTTIFNNTVLTGVEFPDWVDQVVDENLLLTEQQMHQLNQSRTVGNRIRPSYLNGVIDSFAIIPTQTREQQMSSMRQATSNLQSRAEQLASDLEDKPDRGYGKCGICLEGFQPDEIVVDVHPEYNNYKGSSHKFHKDCIMPICNNRDPKCPICREGINCENIKKAGTGAEGTGEVIMNRLQGGKRSKSSKRKSNKRKGKSNKRRATNKKSNKKGKRRVTNKKIKKRRVTNKRRY